MTYLKERKKVEDNQNENRKKKKDWKWIEFVWLHLKPTQHIFC